MITKMRKKVSATILCMIIFVSAVIVYFPEAADAGTAGTCYYVDSMNGDDNNNGTSTYTAWKTLEKVNSITFLPGDYILFKAGCFWSGQLWAKGSGSSSAPIIIDSYGDGNKPIINGDGVMDAVYLYNQEYWEINNLEVTNMSSTEACREGIHISADISEGYLNHVYIKNCFVHDVTGTMTRKDSGGIFVGGRFVDVLIEGCTVRNVYRTGILTATKRNTIVRNNMVDSIGGDGIQVGGGCNSPLVEYNVAKDCYNRYTSGQYNVAIWPFDCNDALLQYNEAYLTRTTNDGQGFDCDYLCNGTIFQYNYSHDNEGGFMLICSIPNAADYDSYNRNSIIRYNISQNDKTRIFQVHSKGTKGTLIYNNTIYVGTGLSPRIYDFDMFRHPGKVCSYNNIFYNEGRGTYFWGGQNYHVFEHNIFYGYHPSSEPNDLYKITANPKMVNPGSGGIGRDTAGGYKLQADSPAINAGIFIDDNGGKDYWGNTLYNGAPDIGAHEYSDEIFPKILPPVQGVKVLHSSAGTGEEQINYSGTWSSSSNDHWSNQVNAFYEVKFTGRQAKIFGPKDPNHGIMAVSIDDGSETIVDTYAPVRKDTVLYSTGLLDNGQHTIKVRVTGTKNQNSGNSYVDVKYVEILPKPVTVASYNAGSREKLIDYSGKWYYGDYDSWSDEANAFYEMKFEGTQVKLYGARDKNYGIVAVSIDGGAETMIDLYLPDRQGDLVLYSSPMLQPGLHTIKVRVTDTKNQSSSGNLHSIEKLVFQPVFNSIYVEPTVVAENSTGAWEEQFNYSGTWTAGEGEHFTNQAGAYYEVKFTGVQVRIDGAKDPNHGIMAVSIDGGTETLIDCYSPFRRNIPLYTSSILAEGQHTLKVRVTGTKNTAANNTFVNVEKVEFIKKVEGSDYHW